VHAELLIVPRATKRAGGRADPAQRKRGRNTIAATQASNTVLAVGLVLVFTEVATYVVGDNRVPRDLLATLAPVQAALLVAVVLPVARADVASLATTSSSLGAALWGTLAMLMATGHVSNRALGVGFMLIILATVFGGTELFAALESHPEDNEARISGRGDGRARGPQ
jgi:hypothetical protein